MTAALGVKLSPKASAAGASNPALILLGLERRARKAEHWAALQFILVNETYGLVPYARAALWLADEGVSCLSGVALVEAQAPYVLALGQLAQHWQAEVAPQQASAPWQANAQTLGDWVAPIAPALGLAAGDDEQGTWLLLPLPEGQGALLLQRREPWASRQEQLLQEWLDAWWYSARLWRAGHEGVVARPGLGGASRRSTFWAAVFPGWPGWHQRLLRAKTQTRARPWLGASVLAAIVLLACVPVRLTVLAPASLEALEPDVIRVPQEGVIDTLLVQPNQNVVAGQPLLRLDLTNLRNRLLVAQQGMEVADTEYRQSSLQSLTDAKSRVQLAQRLGRSQERALEAAYVQALLDKSQVLAPAAGQVILDDPSHWPGKPVSAGERVMLIARPGAYELEIWLAVHDAIRLEPGAPLTVYWNASPWSPLSANLVSVGHEAQARPDGSYAYRVRARLSDAAEVSNLRLGARGTAKLEGETVSLAYWVLRRPLVAVRQWTGW